ncbi:MAG: gliding motility lipoprotein GldH [Raineya sp.]|jgi:gliding motility-associated lipoprotein GldH|nr:gliding motility lipoprotein GldH [Raineya sp.]
MSVKWVLICVLSIFLSSCHTFKEHNEESFPNRSWAMGKEVVFKPVIKDISKDYKVYLELRHIYGLQLKNLSVKVKTISPSGKEEVNNYIFEIMDGNNQYKSNCSGDMCDVKTIAGENMKFKESGEYQIIVTHNIPSTSINGIMGLGLIIDTK